MWPIKTNLFLGGFVAACMLSLAYPIIGVVNYMMVYLSNPSAMWWGKPIESLGIRYSMTAAVCLILGMIVSNSQIPRLRPKADWWMILFLAFTVIVVLSNPYELAGDTYALSLVDKMIKMAIFMFCFTRVVASWRNFRIVIWTFCAGSFLIGYNAFTASADLFNYGRLNAIGAADFRESSGLAAHMSAMLPLVGGLALTCRGWPSRIFTGITGFLVLNTVVLCRTRSAFVGLILAMVVALLMAPRRRRTLIYASLVAGLIGAYSLTDNFYWDRVNSTFHMEAHRGDPTIQSRIELWGISLDMFSEHPFGVGVGQFRNRLADYNTGQQQYAFNLPRRVTHNSYLLCATELGLQGFIVLVLLMGMAFYKIRRSMQLSCLLPIGDDARVMAYCCMIGLVTYLGASAFTDRLYTESFWWVMALPTCLERALRHEVERSQASVPADAQDESPDLADEWHTKTTYPAPHPVA